MFGTKGKKKEILSLAWQGFKDASHFALLRERGNAKALSFARLLSSPPPLHNPTDTHRTYPLALLPVHTSESCPQSNPDSLLSKRTAVCGCEDRRWHLWMCTTLLVRFLKPYTLRGECQRFRRFLCVAYSVNKTLGSVSVWCGEKGERGEGCKVRSEIS